MFQFNVPNWSKTHLLSYKADALSDERIADIRQRLTRLQADNPEVSICIPAYNEEQNILTTLSSLADQQTRFRIEILVANNNSTDRTQQLLDACGVRSVFVKKQGIGHARQAALIAARGKYIVNADSDCLYPPTWVESLVTPLHNAQDVVCTYGTYSFLPSDINPRWALALHETAARVVFAMRRKRGYECVNVMGFNFAFRRDDGLAVGGFNTGFKQGEHIEGEDGWMAMCLLERGRLQLVNKGANAWSSDRRLAEAGHILKVFWKRVWFEIKRLGWYMRPASLPPTA